MTQAQEIQIKNFRKAFKNNMEDMELVAYVRGFRKEKKKDNQHVEKRIDRRFN